MARPTIQITPEQVKVLAARDFSKTEIAAFLGVSYDTLARRFADPRTQKEFDEAFEQGRIKGASQIKNKLFENGVIKGKAAELIFLAKNRVGYTDKQEVKTQVTINHAVVATAELGEVEIRRRLALLTPRLALNAVQPSGAKIIEGIVHERKSK